MRKPLVVAVVLGLQLLQVTATLPEVTSTRDSGGSMQTKLGMGIVLNKESSLRREWITFHDSAFPADLVGTVGVQTTYVPDRVRGSYAYQSKYTLKTRESISAVQVNFLVFDVWGNHLKSLRATEILDLEAGATKEFTPRWNIYSENEASEYYASIAYIARVRTKTGRVVEMNSAPILEEAKKFSTKFTAEDLESKPEPK